MRSAFLRRRVFAAGLAAALCGAAAAGELAGARFHIVTGDDSALTRRIADDLQPRLAARSATAGTTRRMLYVAIGPVALREMAARKCDCALISAYTSSQVWRAVLAGMAPERAASMTAIYAEPAPADQLRLAALLYRRPIRVAAIVGSETGFLKPALDGAAQVEQYAPGSDINQVLNRIGQAQVLLAMPDSSVYNTENIRNILLSTYRRGQAVIGFSADMVKAGALASTYSDIEDINAQVAEAAAAFDATGELPAPQFPHYFSTIVNDGVARSLNVVVDRAARNFGRHPPAQRP
jgi:hypothetical protein